MEYREYPPPASLDVLVKAFWTLDAAGDSEAWIEHQATPDGCIELIVRTSGRSRWGSEQPTRIVVGLSDGPISFQISADASFTAIRLWPWTWRALSGESPGSIFGRWNPVHHDAVNAILDLAVEPDQASTLLLRALGASAASLQHCGLAIINAHTVSEIVANTGMSPRRLQRWFEEYVGLPPRSYLRLLRFQQAFEQLPEADVLAHHAADHGFADQAHMAREFRRLAGEPASRTKSKSRGPFLTASD